MSRQATSPVDASSVTPIKKKCKSNSYCGHQWIGVQLVHSSSAPAPKTAKRPWRPFTPLPSHLSRPPLLPTLKTSCLIPFMTVFYLSFHTHPPAGLPILVPTPHYHVTLLSFPPPPSVVFARLAGTTDPLSAAHNIITLAYFHARRVFRSTQYGTQHTSSANTRMMWRVVKIRQRTRQLKSDRYHMGILS